MQMCHWKSCLLL